MNKRYTKAEEREAILSINRRIASGNKAKLSERKPNYPFTSHPTKRKASGKSQSYLKHRLVWEQKFGLIPKGYLIHHKDGDKTNYRLENLDLLSQSEHKTLHYKQRMKKK